MCDEPLPLDELDDEDPDDEDLDDDDLDNDDPDDEDPDDKDPHDDGEDRDEEPDERELLARDELDDGSCADFMREPLLARSHRGTDGPPAHVPSAPYDEGRSSRMRTSASTKIAAKIPKTIAADIDELLGPLARGSCAIARDAPSGDVVGAPLVRTINPSTT